MPLTPSVAAVARVAQLASDVVVESDSIFSEYWKSPSTSARRTPVISLPRGADVASTLLREQSASLISYTSSSSQSLTRLLPHLPELSTRPVVFHIAVQKDLADVLVLRSSVPYFLHSSTAQQAHDTALLASRLARAERRAVIHVFHVGDTSEEVVEVEEEKVQPFLLAEKSASPRASPKPNGSAGLHANGTENGTHGQAIPTPPLSPKSTAASVPADSPTAVLIRAYEAAALTTLALVRRPQQPCTRRGSPSAETAIVTLGRTDFKFDLDGVSFVDVSLVSPFPAPQLLKAIGASAAHVVVLEQISKWSMKWTPLFLDVISALQQRDAESRPTVHSATFVDGSAIEAADLSSFLEKTAAASPSTRLQLGPATARQAHVEAPHVPKHEASYTKILSHLFADRMEISNAPSLVPAQGEMATSPEFALGRIRGNLEQRAELIKAVQELLRDGSLSSDLHSLLSRWVLAKDDGIKSRALGEEIVQSLESSPVEHPAAARILALRQHFPALSRWIIGSDAWSYDLGASGLHHAIASGLDINILILDTLPYTSRNSADPHRRKRDVGLYAMNHGDVYVASVAVYSSYAQVLQSLIDADKFKGPSVVLAYLPYKTEESPALDLIKETKLAVDSGYWPLYRWDPSKEKEGKEPFSLDSDAVKHDLQAFLDRQNHLSQLTRSKPELASEIVSSLGESVKEARKKRALQAYEELLSGIDAPPITILYASDGGAAEKKAKRLAGRAKARGLSTTLGTLDSMSLDELAQLEEHVVFVTSTAGQGEPPQNGRTFFKALNAAAAQGVKALTKLKYSVFGMGDSHYWPRPEDAHYYNKPGKDLDARLAQLGGERFADLGLGDDQDADGPETGYKVWEPLIWKALKVDSIEVREAEPEPITNEHIKVASQYLRGTIAEGLEDQSTGALAPSDTQLTKFHGIYQQDDRDIRDERQAQGVEPAYSFMIRVRLPGGVCTPQQWLAMDQIADEHGCGNFKLTTRTTFQFHGVIKKHLKPSIKQINRVLLDTLAACGDVNRNVIVSAIPSLSKLHAQVYEFAKDVSEHLLPRTSAYHEIWLDKKMVAGGALQDFEPLYGEFYLPRKFKIAVAVPPTNDVDVFANDLGFIAIIENGELIGFNVTVGGGMGVTHGNKNTYPRIGSLFGFITPDQGKAVAEKIMLVQRDNGNRADRKNARLKYTIDRMGLDVFKAEVEKRLGFEFQPARPFTFDRNVDDFGWTTGEDGKHHFTCFVENGRIQDEPDRSYKTGFREIAKTGKGRFRLTANQHIIITDIETEDVPLIKSLLAQYKLDNLNYSGLRLSSSACVAFPTCGLAMAESERYLPLLIDKVEKICEDNGLRNDSIVMRMTGCPNGCARPYVAEVAFVGKAPGTYLMLLGGGYHGQRMNKIYRESVTEPEILAILKPMIKHYALERLEGEHFGDFVIRAGYIAPTTSGVEWYDRMGGEGPHREIAA